jgi:acetyl-CoA carboxylase carboxyltransferase component
MGITSDRIIDFEKKRVQLQTMGGQKMVEKQHSQGKLTARERLDLLFDEGSFQEIQVFVRHQSTLFGLDRKEIKGDGVIVGFGTVNGRTIFASAQDFTSAGGSMGEMHVKKIWKVMDMALDARKPFVALNDSGGARIQEGVPALDGGGGIFYRNTIGSGYIPQITAVMGPTAGISVYSPTLADWVFMVDRSSYMYITGPDVVKEVLGEEVEHETLGGAHVHAKKSGVCHFLTLSDKECIAKIKKLLSYLPDSCHCPLPIVPCNDVPDRECPELDSLIPDKCNRAYDMKKIIRTVADNGDIFEPHELWAKNVIVAFIRIMGKPVGVIANNPGYLAGVLDVDASDKAARFIRFCDAFNLPLLTFADVPGFMPGIRQEYAGIMRHGSKLLYSYSEATVPKITVIIRKAYGGAYIGMCSKNLGADYVMAWPSAEIAVMGAEGACNIIYRNEIACSEDPEGTRKKLITSYEKQFSNPYFAASIGAIDEVIVPRETRKRVAALLSVLENKSTAGISKKHSNLPL